MKQVMGLHCLQSAQHSITTPFGLALATVDQRLFSTTAPATDSPDIRQKKTQHGHNWTQATHSRFSIKPSVLSPLYSTYRKEQERAERRQLVTKLLEAHSLLASDIEGYDASQVRELHANMTALKTKLFSIPNTCVPPSNTLHCIPLLPDQAHSPAQSVFLATAVIRAKVLTTTQQLSLMHPAQHHVRLLQPAGGAGH